MQRAVLAGVVGAIVVVSMSLGLIMGRSVLAEDGSIAAVSVRTGGTLEEVKLIGSTDYTGFTTTYTTLTSVLITIPEGHTDLVVVTLSAESGCQGGAAQAGAWCIVNMRVGTTNMLPNAGTDAGFDAVIDGSDSHGYYAGHSQTRFGCLTGGAGGTTRRIYVEARASAPNIEFTLDDWTLKIERFHGCATS